MLRQAVGGSQFGGSAAVGLLGSQHELSLLCDFWAREMWIGHRLWTAGLLRNANLRTSGIPMPGPGCSIGMLNWQLEFCQGDALNGRGHLVQVRAEYQTGVLHLGALN